jgi:hypothetical protein
MIIELGPEFVHDSNEYAEMIEQYYNKYLEQRNYAVILRLLYPEYSPKKALESALSDLEEADNKEEAKNAIRQAGLAGNRLYMRSKRFPHSPVRWFESEDLPQWLLKSLEKSFEKFHKQANELESAQTLDTAEDKCRAACRGSRKALLLLSLAHLGYDNEEKIKIFQDEVERARDLALIFAKRAGEKKDEIKKKIFEDRARNMNIRAEVVDAMLDNDMDRASNLLREVIKIALKKEKAKLPG